ASSWPSLPVFDWLEQVGNISKQEMFNVFNMGIGYMITVRAEDVELVEAALERVGETAHRIGKVESRPGIRISGVDQ
ncbi:MAG: phosphoribosylformylglycinamidine cyclo-ligase, partial [Exiguobacterium sp.]|nr:phosphoribosylformylglycinamidine cyclo-ligase [Exiguobacterium sp.]